MNKTLVNFKSTGRFRQFFLTILKNLNFTQVNYGHELCSKKKNLSKLDSLLTFFSTLRCRLTMNNLGEPLTDQEVRSMIEEADLDGDGRINFQEFARQVTNLYVSDICNHPNFPFDFVTGTLFFQKLHTLRHIYIDFKVISQVFVCI